MNLNPSIDSLRVLVTRPAGLAEPLCKEIEARGGCATHFPVIAINDPEDQTNLLTTINNISSFDIALFISPTAVKQTARYIELPTLNMMIGAIGESTSVALEKEGLKVQIKPEGNNSESLLLHPLLQSPAIHDKNIIIFKGEGGRDLLQNTLTSRGANISSANVYRRSKPKNYTALSTSALQHIDVILASSGEGIQNLIDMVEDIDTLQTKKIIVPGERCAAIAKELGFKSIFTAPNATNRSFIETLSHLSGK